MPKTGLQLYTVRDGLSTPRAVYETIEKIKNIGYGCVQLFGDVPTLTVCARDPFESVKISFENIKRLGII